MRDREESRDVFPRTEGTWIAQKMGQGRDGLLEVNHHVMTLYAWPLEVYCRGTGSRQLGEPEDLVRGFFADRLARPDFLQKWEESGLLLRRWLMNAFSYYLKEARRAASGKDTAQSVDEELDEKSEDPGAAMDRAFAISVVRQALLLARKNCEAQGLAVHWQLFFAHQYEGRPYRECVDEAGVDADRASVMARTAGKRFRQALRQILERDGTVPHALDSAIDSLLEVTGS